MSYRESERERAIKLLKTTNLFYGAVSRRTIKYKGKEYPKDEILLDGINNLYAPIQKNVVDYFVQNKIAFWHPKGAGELAQNPTGHILSSQICCINHLFPIRQDKDAVLSLAKMVCNDFVDVLKIDTDKYLPGYIQFESVSDSDHLNEQYLTRGSNCTSVDALIYAVHSDGRKYLLPIEWKYTENYSPEDKSTEDRLGEPKGNELKGQERLRRYSSLIDDSAVLKKYSTYKSTVYFYEPFYQLMRQTLWAEQMIAHKSTETIKADDYIHVHVIPNENHELLNKKYKFSWKGLKETWFENLTDGKKYHLITPFEFIKNIDKNKYSGLIDYLSRRYWGIS
jgi:hypothetical protein